VLSDIPSALLTLISECRLINDANQFFPACPFKTQYQCLMPNFWASLKARIWTSFLLSAKPQNLHLSSVDYVTPFSFPHQCINTHLNQEGFYGSYPEGFCFLRSLKECQNSTGSIDTHCLFFKGIYGPFLIFLIPSTPFVMFLLVCCWHFLKKKKLTESSLYFITKIQQWCTENVEIMPLNKQTSNSSITIEIKTNGNTRNNYEFRYLENQWCYVQSG
jgi:hypothetical protein